MWRDVEGMGLSDHVYSCGRGVAPGVIHAYIGMTETLV